MNRDNDKNESSGGTGYGFGAGFGLGLAVGLTSGLAWTTISRLRDHGVVRIEKSIQIGKPVEEVFAAWANFERLPHLIEAVEEVRSQGSRSFWSMQIDGKRVSWDAELTQNIRNQSLGWKSLSGPQHTGRINFSPLGGDTEVHLVMNYQPSLWARVLSAPVADDIEKHVEEALREFKASLEGKGR